uniref:hypothetical protein n=1 Tax=Streptococcus pneumoniae TaxID=1313 RepID=UPI001954BF89
GPEAMKALIRRWQATQSGPVAAKLGTIDEPPRPEWTAAIDPPAGLRGASLSEADTATPGFLQHERRPYI